MGVREDRKLAQRKLLAFLIALFVFPVAGWLGYLVTNSPVGIFVGMLVACGVVLLIQVGISITQAVAETRRSDR